MTQLQQNIARILADLFLFRGRFTRDAFWFYFILAGIPLQIQQAELNDFLAQWMLDSAPGDAFPLAALLGKAAPMILNSWIFMAATIKRLHDRNKSWVWSLAGSIPLLGMLYLAIECGLLRPVDANNGWGPGRRGLAQIFLGRPEAPERT